MNKFLLIALTLTICSTLACSTRQTPTEQSNAPLAAPEDPPTEPAPPPPPAVVAPRLVVVLGKPYSSKVSGYEPLAQVVTDLLDPLVADYGDQFGGFMAWEFNEDADGSWAATIASTLDRR